MCSAFRWAVLWQLGGCVLEEGGLTPVEEHLHALVCDWDHLCPHQHRHHGHLELQHPAKTGRPETYI